MTLPPLRIRRPGAPVLRPLGRMPAGLDVHALALAMEGACPALLESGGSDRERWHVLPLAPRGLLQARDGSGFLEWQGLRHAEPLEGRGLDHLRRLLNGLLSPPPTEDIPFAGGVVAVLAYDLCREIEVLPRTTIDRDGWPGIHAVACPASLLVDARDGEVTLAFLPDAGGGPGDLAWGLTEGEADALTGSARAALAGPGGGAVGKPAGEVVHLTPAADYRAMVSRVLEYLRAGDTYQVNVAQRFEVAWEGSALALHGVLRATNPSPFSGWLRGPGWELVSGSPERMVQLRGTNLMTEPIAGTAPLPDGTATPPQRVAELAAALEASRKDHAEHVMIVDIHRNDLGRVAAPGTVEVAELMRIDRRSHVLQAVADIRGVLAPGKDAVDVIEAVFPAGCITGVPKIRAMEIIDELEQVRRGPYTGSFGLLAAWGDLDLNVLIRSAWRVGARLATCAGGGVVLDSDPESERMESLAKAAAVLEAVERLR